MHNMEHRLPQGEREAETGKKAADANVERVRTALLRRSEVGIKKYGTTTERVDLSLSDWLRHLQEELMDAAVYVEAALPALAANAEPFGYFRCLPLSGWEDCAETDEGAIPLYERPQPAASAEPVALPSGFLSDVLTAAGLVAYGRRSKGLAARLGSAVVEIRSARKPETTDHATGEEMKS